MSTPVENVATRDGIEIKAKKYGDDFELAQSCNLCIHSKVCAPFLSMVETKKNFDTQFKPMNVEMPVHPEMLAVACKNYLKPQAEGFLK